MTPGPPGPPEPRDQQPAEDRDGPGSLRPLGPGPLTAAAVLGLVGGWCLRPLLASLGRPAPLVTGTQIAALLLVAGLLAMTAWLTRRVVLGRRADLDPEPAVNRLLLARACALVGALVAGGYLGYAVSWLGHRSELAGERFWTSVAAGVAGMLVLAAALLLERACQVPPRGPDPRA